MMEFKTLPWPLTSSWIKSSPLSSSSFFSTLTFDTKGWVFSSTSPDYRLRNETKRHTTNHHHGAAILLLSHSNQLNQTKVGRENNRGKISFSACLKERIKHTEAGLAWVRHSQPVYVQRDLSVLSKFLMLTCFVKLRTPSPVLNTNQTNRARFNRAA